MSLVAFVGLVGTDLGDYLNRSLFLRPLSLLRFKLQLHPPVDDRLRIVLVDDRTLQKLGRHPTFAEWRQISARLFDLGFERTLVQGFHRLPSELGAIAPGPIGGQTYAATVLVTNPRNTLAIPCDELPSSVVLGERRGPAPASPNVANARCLAPHPSALQTLAGIGDISLDELDRLRPAVVDAASGVIPSLGLWAVSNLRWTEQGLWIGDQRVPVSPDGFLRLDLVAFADSADKSVPASAFFDDSYVNVTSPTSEAAKKLIGGKVAILVPVAYTGQRFIDSSVGKVPAYLTTVSVANSALSRRFVHEPFPHALIVLLFSFGLCGCLWIKGVRNLGLCLAGAGILIAGGCVALFQLCGLILPCIQLEILVLSVLTAHFLRHYAATAIEKLKLTGDLNLGRAVQGMLLPGKLSGSVAGWDYRITFRPYGQMSGDWFQTFESPPGAERPFGILAIGDVVGKGPSAALITAAIASVWNLHREEWSAGQLDLERAIRTLDRAIADTFRGMQNSTLLLACVTEGSASLVGYSASYWVKLEGGQRVGKVPIRPKNPLGSSPGDFSFDSVTSAYEAGDVLMAFTDGVMEGSAAHRAFTKAFAALGPVLDEDLFDTLERTARQAGAAHVLPDDFTLLLLRRRIS